MFMHLHAKESEISFKSPTFFMRQSVIASSQHIFFSLHLEVQSCKSANPNILKNTQRKKKRERCQKDEIGLTSFCLSITGIFVKFHQDFTSQLLMSDTLGVAQARASENWMVTGDFALGNQILEDTSYPNGRLWQLAIEFQSYPI